MKIKIWIERITFSDNTTLSFKSDDIVVFVGPNNAGKSATLKESYSFLKNKNTIGKVIKSIEFSKEGSDDDLLRFLEDNSKVDRVTNEHPWYKGLGYNIYGGNLETWWKNINEGIGELAIVLANNLTTEERLKAANPASNIKLTQEPAKHPINILQKHEALENTFKSYFKQAFGLDLLVHRNAGNEVPLYVGNSPILKAGEDRLSENYQKQLEELDLLHEQGDGMRSFVGVLLNAFVASYNLLFIDEPEAFLHPPQARLLGKMLAKDLPVNRQLLLATHSIDFLKGLLEVNSENLKIVRIQRNGKVNEVEMLDNSDINDIWSDSLLRHSNILDGLFHSNVIICESDSDCRFYSAILDSIHEKNDLMSPDVLFVHCGGKHRIPTVVRALKKLNVPIKSICDFDVLNAENPLKNIYEESGGNWNDIKKDWKIVKTEIESKRPELETKELKNNIEEIFASVDSKIMPKKDLKKIQNSLKKASAWSHAKQIGKGFIPNGQAIQAYNRMIEKLKEVGVYVVEVGELESFAKSIGNHGPKWVNDALSKDLKNDPELEEVRKFVRQL